MVDAGENKIYSSEKIGSLISLFKKADKKTDWFAYQYLAELQLHGRFFYENNFRYKTVDGRSYILIYSDLKYAQHAFADDFGIRLPEIKEIGFALAMSMVKSEGLSGLIVDRGKYDLDLSFSNYQNQILPRLEFINQDRINRALKENRNILNDTEDKFTYFVPGMIDYDDQGRMQQSFATIKRSSDQSDWIPIFTELKVMENWAKSSIGKNFHRENVKVFLMKVKEIDYDFKQHPLKLKSGSVIAGLVVDPSIDEKEKGKFIVLKGDGNV